MPLNNKLISTYQRERSGAMLLDVPGYKIQEKLFESAAFKIFRGQRIHDLTPVRIKVLNHPAPTLKLLAPLWQEFEILRLLDIPGVEKAFALENHRQWWMVVLDDLGDQPLNELELAGRIDPREFISLALQLARIIGEIHTRHVIHKNISPATIFFNPSTNRVRLTNFGYASLLSTERIRLESPHRLAEFLSYISPELTGRMNRVVDYRTDYYSLGASLYELLTGTPPFMGASPLELVHAHLASLPDLPETRMVPWTTSPHTFQMISSILLKLLEKNPEDRYQTIGALEADLRHCLSDLQEHGHENFDRAPFLPGRLDKSGELNIPQTVAGRMQETKILLEAYYRTINGPREFVLVTGEEGVGKTTLVNQLVRPVTANNGFFIYAKYDQTRHLDIYPLLFEILEEFCRLVLSEPIQSFREWQQRLQDAVAPHGRLLTDLCPRLETVIGSQPAIDPVDEELTRHRFHQVVIRFLQAICQSGQHLVIFLDELQWINKDTVLLWKNILSDSTLKNLLVVGAYPDSEVDAEHPIYSLAHDAETGLGKVTWLHLQNLEPPLTLGLIATALASDPVEISQLNSLVYQKARGNPYFTYEFLKALYKDQLLVFHADEQKWYWDADRIDEFGIASNVIDFFVHEIVNLDQRTQKVLQYAALLGRRFDSADLLAILGQDQARLLASSLWDAISCGLIYPLDANYRSLVGENGNNIAKERGDLHPGLAELLEEPSLFEFADTHVQRAAIRGLNEHQIQVVSLEIGWRLLEQAERFGPETLEKNLFSIVDHLDKGSMLIQDPAEAIKAAMLNLMASQKVRSLAAFKAALLYLSNGIKLLPLNSWIEHYELTLELYTMGAEIARMNGDNAYAEELALTAETNAHTVLEKIRIMNIRMDIYMAMNQLDQVIELGNTAIRLLDFDLDVEEVPISEIERIIQQSSDMTDPRALTISSLVEPLISSSFARYTNWFFKFIHFFIHLFSRYGNPASAAYVYVVYAVNLLDKFQDVEQAFRMGTLALELAERHGPSKTLYSVRFIYYAFINHWVASARDSIPLLEENAQLAFQFGNLEHSRNSLDLWFQNSLFVGYPLDQLKSYHTKAFGQLSLSRLQSFRLDIWARVIRRLVDESPQAFGINHPQFDQEPELYNQAGQNKIRWFNLYTAQAFLGLVFREPETALRNAALADATRAFAMTHLISAQHLFIYSLALLSPKLDTADQAARLRQVERNLRLMRLWASLVPENYLHQVELVEAELARSLRRKDEAIRKYERAIQDSRQNGFIQECALASELTAEFYLAEGNAPAAKDYLNNAYASYLAWGAKAKLQDLINRYPDWQFLEKENGKRRVALPVQDSPTNDLGEAIDLNTILKASMELAQETNLEELMRKMMTVLIKNAGAQSGLLILNQNDRWYLKIRGSTDPGKGFSLLSTPLDYLSPQVSGSYLPISIIHYVINLKEDLVLEDATASRQFNRDAYIHARRPKSILCAPLLNQGSLIGVVYLENNLTAGAFTSSRLEMVRLISSQAAVSIEKARLYETMELQVQERTRDLLEMNRRLKEEINQRIRIEEALRLSEVRYRTVFENTGTAMALIDEDGYLSLINEKYAELTGYSREELGDLFNFMKIVAPSDFARISHLREDAFADPYKVPYSFEFQLIDRSGSEKPVIATAMFLPGSQSLIVSMIDITMRKQTEEALRYNEALLRKVLDILPVGIWIMDKRGGISFGNPESLRIWSGETYTDWRAFGEYKAWYLDTGRQVSADEWAGRPTVQNGQITLDQELEIEAFDGIRRTILHSAIPLLTDKDERVGAIIVNQDITQRKKDEKELQTAHDQLSTLLEISQSIVSTLDLDILLNLIIEQLGKVIPYEAAAILIVEQENLEFRVVRGLSVYQRLLRYQIPINELTILEELTEGRKVLYISDLQTDKNLIRQIEKYTGLPYDQISLLRSWLLLPLVAKGELIGILVFTQSQPDAYPASARTLSQAYANQVSIAIHNAQLYRQAGDSATLEERNRLARDLHDSLAQALYSISLFITATSKALETNKPKVVEKHLEELARLTKDAISDMRLMIFELRPPILDKVGLVAALQSRLDAVESRAGFQASFHSDAEIQLTPEMDVELYRIAQEALNNVLKHAHANRVSVKISCENGSVFLIIEDDGVGFDLPSIEDGGQGFRNMRERAARIGACCLIESLPGQGTKITIELKQ